MHQFKIISVSFVLTSLFYFGCSNSVTPPIDNNSINIEFPINKKAVYAIGLYEGDLVDSLKPLGVNIFSLQFDTVITKADGLEYIGNIELYYSILDSSLGTGAEFNSSGSIKVSVDNKWVLFQHSEIIESGSIFMKQTSILTDTTLIPTLLNNQFPVFPKKITPNTYYSVYRPDDDTSYFIGVQRDLDVIDYVEWNDIYGNSRGLYYTTEHVLKFGNDMLLNFRGIIDKNGVVTSVITFENSVISTINNPDGGDTVNVHQINRRIIDFTEPENVKELFWYADYVLENGLVYLEEK
ncbi:MAG: hypothetical protein KKF62_04125 [Bacteroidetes bacterium]|nr:hypothetical protein [Bacteroidota bacterium]MBU1116369.1 hypothetical protein [Bacteroidota bacterium]MBU1800393.1 hypothetical protein [Bacteroidota bacterium]